ncbi:hypothetical protein IAE23_25705 [Bacillus sp. S35]|nr:hypothetical protein [Bacillus sp. S35]
MILGLIVVVTVFILCTYYKKVKILLVKLISTISIWKKELIYLVGRYNFWATLISPLIFIGLFYILYLTVPNAKLIVHNLKYINKWFMQIDLNIVNAIRKYPSYTIGVIDVASNVLAIFWSISLTIYFFAYRERKAVAISSNLASGNMGFIIGLALILFDTIYGKIFAIPFNKDHMQIFYHDTQNVVRLSIWFTITLISVFYGVNTLRKMLNSIDIRTLLRHSMSNINKVVIRAMILNRSFKFRKGLYEYLIASIETYYQTLIVCVEKNMMEVYNESFKSLEKFATLFFQGVSQKLIDNYLQGPSKIKVPSQLLYAASNEAYKSLHKSLLIQHVALIKSLHDHNRHSEISRCIQIFFRFEPSDQFGNLQKEFHTILHELIMYLDSDEPVLFRTGLEFLQQFSKREIQKDTSNIGGLRIYKHLLLNSVEQGDINLLSHTAYSMKRLINQKEKTNPKVQSSWSNIVSLQPRKSSNVEKAIIYLILQSILKSIELSKYPVTGFLVKYLVTNYSQESVLKDTFELLKQHNGQDIYLSTEKLQGSYFSELDVDFVFNEDTIEYCMQKMGLIIYTQQVFAKENALPGWKKVGEKIDINFVSTPFIKLEYLVYLEKKIEKAKDKFGLLSLEKMIEYLNNPSSEEEEKEEEQTANSPALQLKE